MERVELQGAVQRGPRLREMRVLARNSRGKEEKLGAQGLHLGRRRLPRVHLALPRGQTHFADAPGGGLSSVYALLQQLPVRLGAMRQLFRIQPREGGGEGRLCRLAAPAAPDVVVQVRRALVGEIEDQEPGSALERVAVLAREQHGFPRGGRKDASVVRLAVEAQEVEPVEVRLAHPVETRGRVVAQGLEVASEALEEPARTPRQERAMYGVRQLVLEDFVAGALPVGGHHQHGLSEEIDRLVERAHAGAGELVEAGRGGELEDAQLLGRQGLAAPGARDQRAADVLEAAQRPPRVRFGELAEQDVMRALQLEEAGAAPGRAATVRASAGEVHGECERAAHAFRSSFHYVLRA